MKSYRLLIYFLQMIFMGVFTVSVLGQNQCPDLVPIISDIASAACDSIAENSACYGNVDIHAEPRSDTTNFVFESPGDEVSISGLAEMDLSPLAGNQWGLAIFNVQLFSDEELVDARLLFFGDVSLRNAGAPVPEPLTTIEVSALRGTNVRARPPDGGVLEGLAAGDVRVANGRYEDSSWVRILTAEGDVAWVFASNITTEGDLSSLRVVTADDPLPELPRYRPMEAFYVDTAASSEFAGCETNGLLIQTPSGSPEVRFRMNDALIEMSGTMFVQSFPEDRMLMSVYSNRTEVTAFGVTQTILPGTAVTATVDESSSVTNPPSQPGNEDYKEVIPEVVTLLPESVTIPDPLDNETLATLLASNGLDTGEPTLLTGEMAFVRANYEGDASLCPEDEFVPPLDAALVIDVSGSMQGAPLAAAKSAAQAFINQLDPETDQLGVVAFSSGASIVSPLGFDYSASRSSIGALTSQGGTAIDRGLLVGGDAVRGEAARPEARRVIVLLSDGGSDPDPAISAANRLGADGIRIVTVALGQGADTSLLSQVASTSEQALYSATGGALVDIFRETATALSQRIAARNVAIRFEVNSEYFQLQPNMSTGATVVSDDIIEWQISELRDREIVGLPLVVTPLETGSHPIGTFTISFDQCSDGDPMEVSLNDIILDVRDELPSQAENIEAANVVSFDNGVLRPGVTGLSNLRDFERERWLLDTQELSLISVEIVGAGSGFAPELIGQSGEPVEPLYTLTSADDSQTSVTVYNVPDTDTVWVDVQSSDEQDVGEYQIQVVEGAVDTPTVINSGEDINDAQIQGEGRTYDLAGVSQGDKITITFRNLGFEELSDETAISYLDVVSLDGVKADLLYSYRARRGTVIYSVYELTGEGPYRIVVRGAGEYALRADLGDTLQIDKGTLVRGEPQTINLTEDELVVTHNFDAVSGETLTLIIEVPNGNAITSFGDINNPSSVLAPDRSILMPNAQFNEYGLLDLKVFEIPEDGVYTAIFELRGSAPFTYDIELVEGDGSLLDREPLELGVLVEDNLAPGRRAAYPLEMTAGVTYSINIISARSAFDIRAFLVDANDETIEADNRIDQSTNSIFIFSPTDTGTYTLVVDAKGRNYVSVLNDEKELDGIPVEVSASANLRAQPSSNSVIAGGAAVGDELLAIGRNSAGDWLQVITQNNELSWIFESLTESVDEEADLDALPVIEN